MAYEDLSGQSHSRKKGQNGSNKVIRNSQERRPEDTLRNNKFFADLLKECDSYIHSS